MPYKGYNFEDGVVINERLVHDDTMTSLHGIVEEVIVGKDDRIISIAEEGSLTEKGDLLLVKTIGEVEQLFGYEELDEETEDISAGQYRKTSPGGRIVDIEIFTNMKEDEFPKLKSLIQKTKRRHGKPPREKFTVNGKTIAGMVIKFKIEQELKIGISDKICNRYGNKGIVSLVEKDELMPRTPWGDKIDFIMNPLGILGRMNVGQMYELYTGLISRELGRRVIDMKKKEDIAKLFKKVMPKLDKSKNKKFSEEFINNFMKLSDAKIKEFLKQVKETGFVPLVIPPFKAPNYTDVKQALSSLNLNTGYKLYLPEFKTNTAQPVPVGYMYLAKLEQIGATKLHGRSTGPVAMKTRQPLAGKRREGGQRTGELDTYAFISYNCPAVLAEMFGPLSEDHITKNEIISDIVQTGSAEYRVAKSSPTKDLLNSYFVSLMLERA